ncbi:helix-turn-helix transcriptional regulator [Leucobacter sp. CSA1]|uniref:Helix-turn-helix transcriptional regulator n=1 Tax=Leucobacter chromiisoli TaxID=2796471 RepID=A0A934Q8K4_9MICO|nr:TetR/AcrR family transcriptional regulator [Leucobacter chromiisoli]MBK0419831.1 helix-turn-helix transcriptional regulator [Leucobacter chromiisoli]
MARTYRSPRREAEAAATRASIIAAAEKLFVRDGYAATSLKAIAAEAGVSAPTVQLQGPKHTLLIAAFEVAFAGDEGSHSLAERPVVAEIMAEPDDERAIERYVSFLDEANQRAAGIVRAMAAAADADPGARAAYQGLETRRRRDLAIAAGWFVERGRIAEEQRAVAADILGYILSVDAYLHFTRGREWTREQWKQWTIHQLRHLEEGIPPLSAFS